VHQYKTEQWLPVSIDQAWDFFATPKNLAAITPPRLGFNILTKLNGTEIYPGMIIDYKVRPLFGIPVHWKTGIRNVLKLKYFTDVQLKGPYKVWEHTHSFETDNEGVLMSDVINYELPLGVFGILTEKLLVRKEIEKIFCYRKKILDKLFSK
jgi:ligand-binding SRPBCC domain-containing protein